MNLGIKRLLAAICLMVDGEPRNHDIEGAFVRHGFQPGRI
jgi:hypothetical protein